MPQPLLLELHQRRRYAEQVLKTEAKVQMTNEKRGRSAALHHVFPDARFTRRAACGRCGRRAAPNRSAGRWLKKRLAQAEAAWAGKSADPSEAATARARVAAAAAPAPASEEYAAALAAGRCPFGDHAAQEEARGTLAPRSLGQIREAAEGGDAIAAALLADVYWQGLKGAPEDRAAALVWATRAISRGNVAAAQFRAGIMHELGQGGLPAAGSEAPRLYRAAAEQGHPMARYRLGVCHSKGRGVAVDKGEAVRHWRAAALLGVPNAQADLASALANGEGAVRDFAAADKLARAADAAGLEQGALILGMLACNGMGRARDVAEAVRWWQKAVEMGEKSGQAMNALRHLSTEGHAEAIAALQHLASAGSGGPQPKR
jgi:TPR repeat protein